MLALVSAFITRQQEFVWLDMPWQLVNKPKPVWHKEVWAVNHYLDNKGQGRRLPNLLQSTPEARNGERLVVKLAAPPCTCYGNHKNTGPSRAWLERFLFRRACNVWRKREARQTEKKYYWPQRQKPDEGSGTWGPCMTAVNPLKWQKRFAATDKPEGKSQIGRRIHSETLWQMNINEPKTCSITAVRSILHMLLNPVGPTVR